jgi:predicted permease
VLAVHSLVHLLTDMKGMKKFSRVVVAVLISIIVSFWLGVIGKKLFPPTRSTASAITFVRYRILSYLHDVMVGQH